MSESDVAVARGDGVVEEEECPLCLEPLTPFWDTERRVGTYCCGQHMCVGCKNRKDEYLTRAIAEGSIGREERQLASTCPLCRTPHRAGDGAGKVMKDKFEKGQLPLHMYCKLAGEFVNGDGGLERDVERGNEILMLGANRGDPHCQYTLGMSFHDGGYGLTKSPEEARRWLLAATEQGHAIAEYCLALMSRDEGNDAEYLRLLRSSASKGFDDACYNMGVTYYRGLHGAQQSAEEVMRAVTPAAERGHAKSMGLLGAVLCQPDPWVPPPDNSNFTKGVHWFRRAAEVGEEAAISQLKEIEEGIGSMCFVCCQDAPPEEKFLRCSRCRAAWYCSKDCQRWHWKAKEGGHKQYCVKWDS